jgi:RNA polymerase sigma factor (sigma-70 family)
MTKTLKEETLSKKVFETREFDDPTQWAMIDGPMPNQKKYDEKKAKVWAGPHEIGRLHFEVQPLLSGEQETHEFRRLNFYKHRWLTATCKKEAKKYLRKALAQRGMLVAANMRIIASVCRILPDYFREEKESECIPRLFHVVDLFDWRRKVKFITYAWRTIRKEMAMSVERDMRGVEKAVPIWSDDEYSIPCLFEVEKREEVQKILNLVAMLPDKERDVVQHRFGINNRQTLTLDKLGEQFGVSRERIRQIEGKALRRLKEYAKVA